MTREACICDGFESLSCDVAGDECVMNGRKNVIDLGALELRFALENAEITGAEAQLELELMEREIALIDLAMDEQRARVEDSNRQRHLESQRPELGHDSVPDVPHLAALRRELYELEREQRADRFLERHGVRG